VAPEGHPLPEHELTVADLAGQAFIDFTEGWGVRTLTDLACGQAGVQRQTVVEVTDTMMCAELVRAGFGLAVLPSSQFSRTWGLTSRTVSGLPSWGVSLVASAARPRSAASAAFAALVGSVFDRALPPALAEGR
jgi:DNA-binding transcriptional LysR family regulator